MIVRCFLWIGEDGGIRVTKRVPQAGSLGEREIVVPLAVNVPVGWFEHRAPMVEIDVPAPPYRSNVTIEVDDPEQGQPEAQP